MGSCINLSTSRCDRYILEHQPFNFTASDMDSVHSHSFAGFTQPENRFDQLYQYHPHLQLDETSDFPSSTSSSVSLSSMFPLPGDYQFPPLPLSLSRRGSDCSALSSTSSEGDGVMMVAEPRGRLTREQICLLERQFSETPKPNTRIRRSLAEATGLSAQRIGVRFLGCVLPALPIRHFGFHSFLAVSSPPLPPTIVVHGF